MPKNWQKGYNVDNKTTYICNTDHKIIPLNSDSVDIILLQDMLEHVPDPFTILNECRRVLKSSGFLCVEFYHYYQRRGSHLTNYIKIPWHHIFFPADVLIEYVKQQPVNSFGIDDRSWAIHVFSTLNKLSYHEFVSHLKKLDFKTIYMDVKREEINAWKWLLCCIFPIFKNTFFLRGTISVFENHKYN